MIKSSLLVLIILISSCTILPPYVAPKENIVELKIEELPDPWICINEKMFALKADTKGNAKVPAGSRIVVGSRHHWEGYNVRYSCNPSISFVPKIGISYFSNWEVIDEACRVEIFQISDKNRVGLDFEKSASRGWCG
jgi:hypothetical protein